jgi:hypothetical protein
METLTAHPEQVKALLAGDLDATEVIAKNPATAQKDVADLRPRSRKGH